MKNSNNKIKKTLNPSDPRYMTPEQEQIVNLILSENNIKSGKDVSTVFNELRGKVIQKLLDAEMDEEWEKRIQEGDAEEKAKIERKMKERARRAEERGEKRGEKHGIKTAIKQMVQNMIRCNETDEKIILYANINKRELSKIKQELQEKTSFSKQKSYNII